MVLKDILYKMKKMKILNDKSEPEDYLNNWLVCSEFNSMKPKNPLEFKTRKRPFGAGIYGMH